MKVLSILNNKGGVGKTTIATWLGQGIALTGKKVLLIDNDKQHNLSNALAKSLRTKSVRDIYRIDSIENINRLLNRTVQQTSVDGLYFIPSSAQLSYFDVPHIDIWKEVLEKSSIPKVFDAVIFDNAPGSELLQASTVSASDMVVVPSELNTKSSEGLFELCVWLDRTMGMSLKRIRIVPNGMRRRRKDEGYLQMLQKRFPGAVTTAIPFDDVFDEMDALRKVMFFSRMKAKVMPFVIKVMCEIYEGMESVEAIEEHLHHKQKAFKAEQARKRYWERRKA
ncbi:MAG: ParA family protein [Chitinispirillaceae bacterium]